MLSRRRAIELALNELGGIAVDGDIVDGSFKMEEAQANKDSESKAKRLVDSKLDSKMDGKLDSKVDSEGDSRVVSKRASEGTADGTAGG